VFFYIQTAFNCVSLEGIDMLLHYMQVISY